MSLNHRSSYLLALFFAACGGSQAAAVTVTPFTAEHEPAFENGLDMVSDPDSLGGAWLGTWEEELDRRVTFADAVALVTVVAVRQDTDLERRDTLRLVTHVETEYFGELEDDLTLSVVQGESGYGTVESNERSVLDMRFIAFVKWQREEGGALRARWHLSPATEPLARRVRRLLRTRRHVDDSDGTRRIVVVHQN